MEKMRNVSYKDWQPYFQKKTKKTKFSQKERKTYDANDLLALSLVRIIVYIYCIGKKFYCTYLK